MEGAHVLVVEDDESIRELIADFLRDEGYLVESVPGGGEALEMLSRNEYMPDIMLLDLLMPEIDGYQVLDQLRRDLLQEFPVLIFSAQKPGPSVLRALDSELRDFIAKPFDLSELLVRIQRLLQRSPRASLGARGCLRVYALGALRVYFDEQKLFDESWRNKPAKTIFKMLLTFRAKRFQKDMLAEELWPEADPDAASNRLRVAIHELRKILGERGRQEKGKGYIGQQEGSYFFNTASHYWLDVDAFEELAANGRHMVGNGDLDGALHAFQQAEALYQGEYLRDDPFYEWSISTRERLREEHLNLLGEVARIQASRGQNDEAAAFCRKILRIEPWREEVYRRLMEYLAAAGRPHEALRAYEDCRRALRAEVEADPSPETKQLREQIVAANG